MDGQAVPHSVLSCPPQSSPCAHGSPPPPAAAQSSEPKAERSWRRSLTLTAAAAAAAGGSAVVRAEGREKLEEVVDVDRAVAVHILAAGAVRAKGREHGE